MPPTVGPGPTIVYNTKAQRANSIYFIIVPYCFVLLLEAQIARTIGKKVWLAKKINIIYINNTAVKALV